MPAAQFMICSYIFELACVKIVKGLPAIKFMLLLFQAIGIYDDEIKADKLDDKDINQAETDEEDEDGEDVPAEPVRTNKRPQGAGK